MNRISVSGRSVGKREREAVRQVVSRTFKNLGVSSAEIEIFLLPNWEMRTLKRKFFGSAPRVVDVLSFPEARGFFLPARPKLRRLGEVYLNRGFLERPRKLAFFLIHGVLHLLGYDHEKKRDMLNMQKMEARLAGKIAKRPRREL